MTDARKYTQKLSNQRVLIIGGTSGLGYGVAEALLEHNSTIIISSSNADKIASTISRLESSYPSSKGKIQGHVCNLALPTAADEVAALFSKCGTLDHVIFTAGDPLNVKPLEDFSLSEMQQTGMVRFFGPMLVAQHLKKHLRGGPQSSFTITSGGAADRPSPNWAVMCGYLSGVYGLMRGLALDLAPIRVNVVSPGAVETELWEPFKKAENWAQMLEGFKKMGTTGDVGSVEDVVHAYLYLLKDRNVTGTVITSNSGAMLK